MADGKWIRGLRPDLPLAEAAREVLTARLEVVRNYLPKAMRQADEPLLMKSVPYPARRLPSGTPREITSSTK